MNTAEQERFNSLDFDDPMVGRILDAAEQCIHRFGIRRTSMGEVARVGKLSRGSIYRHFGDKESLVEVGFWMMVLKETTTTSVEMREGRQKLFLPI